MHHESEYSPRPFMHSVEQGAYRSEAQSAVVEPSVSEELRALVSLAVPIALAQFAQIALNLTDTAIIGRTSPIDLAGTGIGRTLSFAFASFCLGIAGALDPLASQAIGAKEPRRAWGAFLTALRANALLLPFIVVLILSSNLLLPWFGVDRAVTRSSGLFLLGHVLAIPLFGVFLCARGYLQALNKTGALVWASILANVVNVPVCLFFVRYLRWGAFGAGVSTTIATSVLTLVALAAAVKHKPAGILLAEERIEVRRLLTLGLPVSFQMLAEIGVFSAVGILTGRLGAVAASAHQIALSLASFTFMGALGISAATATRVGYAVGEGRSPRRAGLVGIATGSTFMLGGALLFALFARQLASVFTADPAVVQSAVPLLMLAALFQLFDGAQVVAGGALRGIAEVKFAFLANVVSHWFVGFPIAIVCGIVLGGGIIGLWIGLTTGLVVVAFALTARFLRKAQGVIARA